MKNLKKITTNDEVVPQLYTVVYYNSESKDVILSPQVNPNTSVWYMIDSDNVLHIRATQKDGYSERVLYTDTDLAKNGWYNDGSKIVKATIEETIYPTSCVKFFDGCNKMATIENFGRLRMDACQNCHTMFQQCNVLTSVGDLSNWNVNNVTDMSGIFSKCYALTSVDLSNWDVSNVTNTYGAFYENNSLVSLSLPSTLKTIGEFFLADISSLTSLTILATTPPTLGANAFRGTTMKIYVPSESVETYKTAWSAYADRIEAIA